MAGFGLASTSESLQGGIDGEDFEVQQMYPPFTAVAREQNEKGNILSFHYALEAEKIHAAVFTETKQSIESGEDKELGDGQISTVCAHTKQGNAPDRCPVCGQPREVFVAFRK
jgi:rubrerythrin